VLFGDRDILINNIAWFLRRFPAFGVLGDGQYRLQPIHVEDFAELAVRCAGHDGNEIVYAIGPETFTFRELVTEVARSLEITRPIVAIPPWLGLWVTRAVGWMVGDVVLTADEVRGLMANTLVVNNEPVGTTRLTDWARAHRNELGRIYASELGRRRT
jgi:NADH dehydrogenase